MIAPSEPLEASFDGADRAADPARVVVLVPDQRGVEAFEQLARIEPLIVDPTESLPPRAAEAEVLVTRGIDPESAHSVLTQLPRLRMIQLFSAGCDGWAGVVPEGVTISGADRAHGATVAEWIIAQLLSHYRELPRYQAKQREQVWQTHATSTLAGKRVMVLGAGDIAEHLRRRIEPFGVQLTLVGRTARAGIVDFDAGRAILVQQDVVVLALPLVEETRQLVDAAFLAAMSEGSVLVNAGRGALVDTSALVASLEEGHVHAILDVTDPEPLPPGHPLWTARGVVITPHSAAITEDTSHRCWEAIVRNVSEFVDAKR